MSKRIYTRKAEESYAVDHVHNIFGTASKDVEGPTTINNKNEP